GHEAVTGVLRIREKQERDGGSEGAQLGEGAEAASGGEGEHQQDDIDPAPREPVERCVRRYRRNVEMLRRRAVEELPHVPDVGVTVAHDQDDEPATARDLTLAATRAR